jgi:type VI secretion system ImpC/EvpB family protein
MPFFAAQLDAFGDGQLERAGQSARRRQIFVRRSTAFKSLRDAEDSRYVGLCMPRVLARLPYGAKSEPVEEFAFEEDTDGHKGEKYGWMNAAYAMAANVNRAFKEWGWTVRIRGVQSGGEVINLPTHTFPTDDGGVDLNAQQSHQRPSRG